MKIFIIIVNYLSSVCHNFVTSSGSQGLKVMAYDLSLVTFRKAMTKF